MFEESLKAFLQEWTPRDERARESLLSMKNPRYRYVDWSEDKNIPHNDVCVTTIARLLYREGPLIAKNLQLGFDEIRSSKWFDGPISLHDFLYRFGSWFDELYINTLSDGYDEYCPMSETKIAQIVESSRIQSIVISARHIIPFAPLIREPHVRKVTLINGWIDQQTVEFFMRIGRHCEELILNKCRFDPGIIQALQESSLVPINITGRIEFRTVEDEEVLSTCPFITEHCHRHHGENDDDDGNDDEGDGDDDGVRILEDISTFSYLVVNSSITKLSLSSYKRFDHEIFFSTLATMTQLRNLSLFYMTEEHDLETITTLTNLYKLCLCGNRSLGDRSISMLEKFPKLRSLDLSYSVDMTPTRCDLISQSCPHLDRLICYYYGYFTSGEPSRDVGTLELLEMIQRLARTMKFIKSLRILVAANQSIIEAKSFLSHQLITIPLSTLESISLGSYSRNLTELLRERRDMLRPYCNQYLYVVFILIRAWNQRIGSLIILPKDIVNLIVTEHAPLLGRREFAIQRMVEFVWNHWRQMEQLIREKRRFKVVQSKQGENIRLVSLSPQQQWEEIK